jgi:uncharacterized protein
VTRPLILLAAFCGLLLVPAAAGDDARQIGWSDLQAVETASSDKDGVLVQSLAGQYVELAGYLLPSDREDDLVYEFMLVSQPGACSHMAQPPANQIVRVVPERPYVFSQNYEPVIVSGHLRPGLEKTQLFIVDGVAVVESGYSMANAHVRKNASHAPMEASPWGRLTR